MSQWEKLEFVFAREKKNYCSIKIGKFLSFFLTLKDYEVKIKLLYKSVDLYSQVSNSSPKGRAKRG